MLTIGQWPGFRRRITAYASTMQIEEEIRRRSCLGSFQAVVEAQQHDACYGVDTATERLCCTDPLAGALQV